MKRFFRAKRKGMGMMISVLIVCVVMSYISVNMLQVINAGYVGEAAARTQSKTRMIAESKAEFVKAKGFTNVANEARTAYGTTGYETEVVVGSEVDMGGGNKVKEVSVNVYKPSDTASRFNLTVPLSTQGSGNSVPAGSIFPWYGTLSDIPSGFLYCDGTNGTPDLRGKTVIGTGTWSDAYGTTDYNLGDSGGERLHQLSIQELPSHSITFTLYPSHGKSGTTSPGLFGWSDGDSSTYGWAKLSRTSDVVGNDRPHNNMQPFIAIHWIMKL